MGKKVAMITFCEDRNYGSVLQAYALQQVIKRYGCEPELLVHREKPLSFAGKIKKLLKPDPWYSYWQKLKRISGKKKSAESIRKIRWFKQEQMKIGYIDSVEEVKEDAYDKFLAGSDQIWSLAFAKRTDFYTLSFVQNKAKKYSYGVSLGNADLSEENKHCYKQQLQNFDHLSVREKSAKTVLEDILGKSVREDIDPVLLLEPGDWERLASVKNIEKPFIFVYQIRPDKKPLRLAKELAKKEGLDIYYVGSLDVRDKAVKTVYDCGVEEYLSYMKQAKYVITNSFHGTLFSVIFRKQFVSFWIAGSGNRIEEFLDWAELKDRYVSGDEAMERLEKPVDYNKAVAIIEHRRQESLEYLRNIFG